MFDLIQKAALAGGDILLNYYKKETLDVINKTDHHNIVTAADKESQQVIKDIILDGMKEKGIPEREIGFIGEEDLHQTGDHTFVIDPLDGTSNFATSVDDFCVLIAYFYKSELQTGIMYFPTKKWTFWAEKGKGSYVEKDGKKTKLEALKKDFKETFLYSSLSYKDDIQSGLYSKLPQLKSLFRAIRMVGCAGTELAFLTENIAGTVIIVGCSIWDIAPAKIILAEAGHQMYDWNGNEVQFDLDSPKKIYPIIACHPDNRQPILDIFA